MTGTAPITQDVLTIPRKVAEDKQGRVNLVGLTRDGLREALNDLAKTAGPQSPPTHGRSGVSTP